MTTTRKNHGPFITVRKSIKATLRRGAATLTCHLQKGVVGTRAYRFRKQWYIQYDGQPCAMGPWKADQVRNLFA